MKNWMVYASGVFFFAIILIVLIIVFTRGNDKKPEKTKNQPTTSQAAPKLEQAKTAGSSVSYKIRGAVVGEERHRGIRITISASTRTVEILSGYNDQVIKTQTNSNTQAAYDALLQALDGAGFDATKPPREGVREASACPLGQHFEYLVSLPAGEINRSWATSCSPKDGSFNGNGSLVRSLFQKQIPEYSKFVAGVRLGA